jgi:hypothetical protein
MNEQQSMTEKMGGRKALAFYAALACCFILALLDKAHAEVLGLIDTLFFIYAGANVMVKRQANGLTDTMKTEEKTDEKPSK